MAFINLLGCIYPVGSIYLSTSNISPSTLIGGTWVQIRGAMLGITDGNDVAKAASYGGNLAITINQMPSHTHGFQNYFWRTPATSYNQNQWLVAHTNNEGTTPTASSDFVTASTGGNQNFLPYHFGVYGWYRTA